jgi:transcriptional regulator with XRE-family HTH domain
VAGRERAIDRGTRLGRAALVRLGQESRDARLDRGLSIDAVAVAMGISNAEVSRIERALSPRVPAITLFRLVAVVGLDLSARLYPGSTVLRDAGQVALLADFRTHLHPSIGFATEVPLPMPGDQRAWDAMLTGRGWRFGVEGEVAPRDAQALNRRLQLKLRDGQVDGVVLVCRASRRTREFLVAARPELQPTFPIDGRRALAALANGVDPGGSAIIVLERDRGPRSSRTPRDPRLPPRV